MKWTEPDPNNPDFEIHSSCGRFAIRRPAGHQFYDIYRAGQSRPVRSTVGLNAARAWPEIAFGRRTSRARFRSFIGAMNQAGKLIGSLNPLARHAAFEPESATKGDSKTRGEH